LGESGHQREGIDLSWGTSAVDGEELNPSASFSNKMLFFVTRLAVFFVHICSVKKGM
jgi:hypothetical protein